MPHKGKLSAEAKVELARRYLSGELGSSEAARKVGVDKKTLRRWVQRYESEGVEAFLPGRNRQYPPELKQTAVEDYLSGAGSQYLAA